MGDATFTAFSLHIVFLYLFFTQCKNKTFRQHFRQVVWTLTSNSRGLYLDSIISLVTQRFCWCGFCELWIVVKQSGTRLLQSESYNLIWDLELSCWLWKRICVEASMNMLTNRSNYTITEKSNAVWSFCTHVVSWLYLEVNAVTLDVTYPSSISIPSDLILV